MSTFLFDELIFGPVFSRRLGISLGINLLPRNAKLCNFNCIYCECGLTGSNSNFNSNKLPEIVEFEFSLENKLIELKNKNKPLNNITFAGNGEPTLHPDFDKIIDKTIDLRNKYFPEANISVLTNSTNIGKERVLNALLKIEQPILKLDSVFEKTYCILNSPPKDYSIEKLKSEIQKFNGNFIIQTLFIKGKINENIIDNSTDEEVAGWLKFIEEVKPKQVMIYTIARETPVENLEKINVDKLTDIALKVKELGIDTLVSA